MDKWLTTFYGMNDPFLIQRLQAELRQSWVNWVNAHPFQTAHDIAFKPPPQQREEKSLTTVRVITGSERKWKHIAPLIEEAKFIPLRTASSINEAVIHARIRRNPGVTENYAMHVAAQKQENEALHTVTVSMDTVIMAEGLPMEKPKTRDGARRMIRRTAGKTVTNETGFVIGMPLRSGRIAHFLNQISLTYTLKLLSSEEIARYEESTPYILDVAGGLDLTNPQNRRQFIDPEKDIIFSGVNFLNERGSLRIKKAELEDPVLDAYFAGIPTHSARAFFPLANRIYAQADPLAERSEEIS